MDTAVALVQARGLHMAYPVPRRIRHYLRHPFARAERITALQAVHLSVRPGDRLAVLGTGAGGATALYALALDKRFRVGISAGQLGTHTDKVAHLIKHGWQGLDALAATMCPGVFAQAELSDIASLCAPQPLMMLHAPADRACPVDSARECAREIRDGFAKLGGKGHFSANFLPEFSSRAYEDIRAFLALHLRAQFV